MLVRVVIAAVLVGASAGLALLLDRRRSSAAPSQGRDVVPHQLDRSDFPRPEAPWLVVLWSSQTCDSCQGLAEKLAPLAGDDVAIADIEFPRDRALHERYRIEAAPITMVVDALGVTQASFVGAYEASELWGVVAALRSAGADPSQSP